MDSPFVSRLLAKDAWSRGRDQGGSSSHSSLGVRLHHGGHWLRGAECAGDGAGDKALGQNDTWATGRGTEGLSSQRAAQWEKLTTPLERVTGFCFSLALLLSDDGRRLDALRRRRRVERLHADGRLLDALGADGRRLDALGADLRRGQPDPVHRHQLHVVQVDGGGHAHSSLGGQC